MCGIAALYNFSEFIPHSAKAESVVCDMMDTLVHRGPDAEGLWADERGRCILGHRRLSIIDTSTAGRQPMLGANGRWVIAFNGELYNFLEVRQQLEAKGVRFRGRTDTEVLIEAIAFWGIDALAKLDGMFAFAAFDTVSGELIVARDAFGEKPLYYIELPGRAYVFASELQALEKVPGFDAEISLDAMAEVLMFQYIGAPRSIFQSVKKLSPGHWIRLKPGQPPVIGRFFDFRPGAAGFDRRPLATLADELEDILLRSIKRRLISDVPLGAFLSGGVDSSTVCALIIKKMGLPLKTFSIGFRGAPESEHRAAREFARQIGSTHHDQVLSPDTTAFLLEIGRLLDEPNADSSCMPTYLLSQFARQQVTVAVSGDGGDEMFVGYGRYFTTLEEEKTYKHSRDWNPGKAYYSGRILVSSETDIIELFGFVPDGLREHLYRLVDELRNDSVPLFCRLRKTDVDNYLPGAILPKVDRMSMQHSLEVRTPYLNVDLARFVERLPIEVLYRDRLGKLILREVAYRYLPSKLVNAPKKGFGIPVSSWAKAALLKAASELLEAEDSRLLKALGRQAIGTFLTRQRSSKGHVTYQVWALVMLESWLRHHPSVLDNVSQKIAEMSNSHRKFNLPFERKLITSRIKKNVYAWFIVTLVSIYLLLVGFYLVVTGRVRSTRLKGIRRRIRRWFYGERPFAITGVLADWIQKDCLPAVRFPLVDSPIVVLTHSLPAGGAERQWCYLAAGLKERGHKVVFVSINELLGPDAHYLPLLQREKVSVVELAKLPSPDLWDNNTVPPDIKNPLLYGGCAIAIDDLVRLTELFRSLRPRAVIAQLDYPNLLAAMAALLAGVPRTILSFRNYNPTNFSYLRNDWFQKYYQTVASSKRIILTGNTRDANCDYAKWIGISSEQVHWIPNSIDPTYIESACPDAPEELRQTLGIPSGQPVILGVFRLSEEKRPLLFVEVCARIVQHCANVRVLVAGTGPMRQQMQDRIHELGLGSVVTLLGRRDDIAVIMRCASLLLLTSSFEGMPNAVMEAQLLGLPVVGPYLGGMPDCVEDGRTGFLVRDDNTEELANACIAILTSPDLQRTMGQAATRRMRSMFSRDAMVSSYLELVLTATENESHSAPMACTDRSGL